MNGAYLLCFFIFIIKTDYEKIYIILICGTHGGSADEC